MYVATDEKTLASQVGVTGKAKDCTTLKNVSSFQSAYFKNSIPPQRGYKPAALLGLLMRN